MFRCLVLILALVAGIYGWGRIVGGKDADIKDHNYQVSLRLLDKHWCGGALLKPNAVVTAAHCVHGKTGLPSFFSVQAGSNHRKEGGDVRDVETIYKDKRYTKTNHDYDIAVVILEEPFNLSDNIGIIELVPKHFDIPVGTLSVVTGWGDTKEEGELSDVLQSVEVPNVDWNRCAILYARFGLTDRMSCWGYTEGGKDACQGDSGGPLVIEKAGDRQLAGVVSWGDGCARPDSPGVYADITNPEIHDFITNCLHL